MARAISIAVVLVALSPHVDVRDATQQWSVVVCGVSPDPRRVAADEAVAFWNDQLAALGAHLSLGPVASCDRTVPDAVLRRISDGVLEGGRLEPFPRELQDVAGDVVVALSETDLISVGIPRAGRRRGGLVVVRQGNIPPLSLPNVSRNVLAHELGHVLGLPHLPDPTLLMCGRPSPCRPALFQSPDPRFFPLTDAEKRDLAKRYR
jgi:hypothetical protein